MRLKSLVTVIALLITLTVSSAKAAEFEMVEYSAQVKLQWLAAAGIPEAKTFLKKLNKPNIYSRENLKDFDRIEMVNSVYEEISYASVNHFIKSNGYKNVFDIACSYSPRVLNIVKGGGHYIGAELAAVSLTATNLVRSSLDKKYHNNFYYSAVPVENEELMLGASSDLKGKICIVENGLMVYLTDERRDSMLRNIREILKDHGGCFITSDFTANKCFSGTAAALYGADAQTLCNETQKLYEDTLGDKLFVDTFKSDAEAIAYLKSFGFNVERIPLLPVNYKLYSYAKMTDEQVQKIRTLTSQDYLWVLTVK